MDLQEVSNPITISLKLNGLSKTADPTSRAIPLLPFLARAAGLLRRQHKHRRHFWRKEMFTGDGRLLRMLAPQERGDIPVPLIP